MRKSSVWVLCGLMGLTTAAFAGAQATGTMGTESGSTSGGSMSGGDMAKAAKPAKPHHKPATMASMTGEVTAADATAKTFTLKGKKSEKNFLCSDTTKFSQKGKTCADIAMGNNLTVWYNKTLTVVPIPAAKIRFNKTPAAAPAAAKTPSK